MGLSGRCAWNWYSEPSVLLTMDKYHFHESRWEKSVDIQPSRCSLSYLSSWLSLLKWITNILFLYISVALCNQLLYLMLKTSHLVGIIVPHLKINKPYQVLLISVFHCLYHLVAILELIWLQCINILVYLSMNLFLKQPWKISTRFSPEFTSDQRLWIEKYLVLNSKAWVKVLPYPCTN